MGLSPQILGAKTLVLCKTIAKKRAARIKTSANYDCGGRDKC